jgi:hypothetical protein
MIFAPKSFLFICFYYMTQFNCRLICVTVTELSCPLPVSIYCTYIRNITVFGAVTMLLFLWHQQVSRHSFRIYYMTSIFRMGCNRLV